MIFKNTFKNKKILITGHTGFKGSWLALWLSSLGAKVTGVSKYVPTQPSHFESAQIKDLIEDIRLDILNISALKKVIYKVKPDFVFHLAAQSLVSESYLHPLKTFQVNTIGTANILEIMRDFSRKSVLILITSDKCYLNREWIWGYKETDTLGGIDPYSASKASAEILINSYINSYFQKNSLVRIGIGRAGNVIGGGDWAKNRIVPDCMRAAALGEIVEIRNPCATRPWQHVLEPLSGYLTLAKSLVSGNKYHGEAFNFGPSNIQNASVEELVQRMSIIWKKVICKDISNKNNFMHESGLLKLNCDKAFNYLNWNSRWDLNKTIKETVIWYKNYYSSKGKNMQAFSLEQISDYENQLKD